MRSTARADAAQRELAERTGLDDLPVHLEQLATYGAPRRDPRMRVVSVAYLAFGPELPEPVAGADASEARWRSVADLLSRSGRLAFDHGQILADGLERARAKLEYSPLATVFCGPEFTVAELRRVYEVVWGTELDPRNFHRKVTGSPGFLLPTNKLTARQGGRPARLYRRGHATLLNPPISR
jgi:8-oxo-dGTP diphosphatase